MGNGYRAKHKHFFNKIGKRNRVSGDKYKKAIDRYITLLVKQDAKGETLWVQKTKEMAHKRFAKYGIRRHMIEAALAHKGKEHLASHISF